MSAWPSPRSAPGWWSTPGMAEPRSRTAVSSAGRSSAARGRAAASRTPSRPSRLWLWLRRRRGLARPAGLALLGGGGLVAAALAVMAADPYGRLAALWEGAAEIGANA